MRRIDLCGYFGYKLPNDAVHGTRFTHGNRPPRASPYAFRPRLLRLVVCSFYSSSFFIWCRKSLKPTRLSRLIEEMYVTYEQRTVSKSNRPIKREMPHPYCSGGEHEARGPARLTIQYPSVRPRRVLRRQGGAAHIWADH